VNRGKFKNTDVADLLVSECVATVRAVGTSMEIPINGISPGNARNSAVCARSGCPDRGNVKKKEVTVVIEDGAIKIGAFRHTCLFAENPLQSLSAPGRNAGKVARSAQLWHLIQLAARSNPSGC